MPLDWHTQKHPYSKEENGANETIKQNGVDVYLHPQPVAEHELHICEPTVTCCLSS